MAELGYHQTGTIEAGKIERFDQNMVALKQSVYPHHPGLLTKHLKNRVT